jgi:hypothetical protein
VAKKRRKCHKFAVSLAARPYPDLDGWKVNGGRNSAQHRAKKLISDPSSFVSRK